MNNAKRDAERAAVDLSELRAAANQLCEIDQLLDRLNSKHLLPLMGYDLGDLASRFEGFADELEIERGDERVQSYRLPCHE